MSLIERNMSLRSCSHMGFLPVNLNVMSEKYDDERFHRDIKNMKGRYQGICNKNIMTDYCFVLAAFASFRKTRKRSFNQREKTIFNLPTESNKM